MGKILNKMCECPNNFTLNSSRPGSYASLPSNQRSMQSQNHKKTKDQNLSLKQFLVERVLGKGGFAKVLLVKKIEGENQQRFAMKILKKSDLMTNKLLEATILEKNILQKTNHPFVVHLNYAFQTSHKIYLVMEYLPGGDFYQFLRKNVRLKEDVACFYIAEVILGLDYLHKEMNIIYRDLKPENILISEAGHIKLTDFGLSKQTNGKTYTFAGTPEYLAPEILLETGQTKALDWWSVGILLYEMLAGVPPFTNKDKDFEKIKQLILENNPRFPSYFSEESKSIITRFLQTEPNKRLGVRSILDVKKHPFFRNIDWDELYEKNIEPPLIGRGSHVKNSRHGHQLKESFEGSGMPRMSGITYNPENEINQAKDEEDTNCK